MSGGNSPHILVPSPPQASQASDSASFSRTDDRRHHLLPLLVLLVVSRTFLSLSTGSSCPSTRTCLTTGHPHRDTDPRPRPPVRRTARAQDDRVAAAVTEAQAPGMVSMAGHQVDTAVRPAVTEDAEVTAAVVAGTGVAVDTTGRATFRSRPQVPSP